MSNPVTIIGGGLAGSEAAWQLARRGVSVRLFEMRPVRKTAAHASDRLGELVCSNSFRSASLEAAVGLLKEEMRRMGSIVMRAADRTRVPAGSALAVDREAFAEELTVSVQACPNIEVVRQEVAEIGDEICLIASGPLTSPSLSSALQTLLGEDYLYFYDAIAPIISADSIDRSIAFAASRWGKGGDDYVNCPMTREEYYAFVDAVVVAEKVPTRDFERCVHFEGCMPIEEMARRGRDTLAFGPMRPVGLTDPRTGSRPFAVVQLRQDNAIASLFNIVGFQTKMTYPEQRRVLRMIPGLEHAEFVRLGSLHRNTFINAPRVLGPTLQLRSRPQTFLAGQLVGVEGYVESAATGLLAGVNIERFVRGAEPVYPPQASALGSLLHYISDTQRTEFQPMNANYGLFPPLEGRARGRDKKRLQAERAAAEFGGWLAEVGIEDEAPVSSGADAVCVAG